MSFGIRSGGLPLLLALATVPAVSVELTNHCRNVSNSIRISVRSSADVCFHCTRPGSGQTQGRSAVRQQEEAFADLGEGRRAIIPGNLDASELIRPSHPTDPDLQMPPPDAERKLSARQISLFRRWIEQGAKWDKHWSFERPIKSEKSPTSN